MNKTYSRIINEEVNRQVKKLSLESPKQITEVLKELFFLNTEKLMSNIGSVEGGDNEIDQDNWDWFLDTLTQSIGQEKEEWLKAFKEVKEKILTLKYFSRRELIAQDQLERHLRLELKPYFTALQNYRKLSDFKNKILILPSDLLYSLVRYLFSLSTELKTTVKVTNDDLVKRIEKCTSMRLQVAKKIGAISNAYQTVFDIKEVKELYDNGILFEDNMINRAINEYMSKLLNHQEAYKALLDVHPASVLQDMKKQLEGCSAYMEHVKAIKNESGSEYFSSKGAQIGRRFDNDLEMVTSGQYDGYVVDNKSRLKEPVSKLQHVAKPWEQGGASAAGGDAGMDGAAGGGPGGGGFGGGGGSFGGGMGGSDFDSTGLPGDDFADPGEEGEIPGVDDAGPIGTEEDGTPMPDNDGDGLPDEFGTAEDNGADTPADAPENDKKPEVK